MPPSILIVKERNCTEASGFMPFLPGDSYFVIVLEELHQRYHITIQPTTGEFTITDEQTTRVISSKTIRTVWVKDIVNLLQDEITNNKPLAKYYAAEYATALSGIIACAEKNGALLVNQPDFANATMNKVKQQIVAASLGMEMPEQCILNRKKELNELPWLHKSIFKPLHSSNIHVDKENGRAFMGNPVILTPQILRSIEKEEIDFSLHYFQERMVPKAEYRVVVFGNHVYAFRITGEYEIDWRDQTQLTFECDPNFSLGKACISFLKIFNVALGCFDFIETEKGIFFLEANCPGHIRFCDPNNRTGLLSTFAEYLLSHK